MAPGFLRAFGLFALACALCTLTGCWSYWPSGEMRYADAAASSVPTDAWPSRDIDRIRPLYEGTPAEHRPFRVVDGIDPATLTEDEKHILSLSGWKIRYKGIHGNFLLRVFEPLQTEPSANPEQLNERLSENFLPNARAVSSRTLDAMERGRELLKELDPPSTITNAPLVSSIPIGRRPKIAYIPDTTFLDAGKPLRVPMPEELAHPVRGVVIHFLAIGANEFEPRVMSEFRRRGWAVFDISTESFVETPVPDDWKPEIKRLGIEADAIYARMTSGDGPPGRPYFGGRGNLVSHPLYGQWKQLMSRRATLRAGAFQACGDEALPGVAKDIAARIDQALAGNAYAVEMLLDYIDTQRPELAGLPVVMIGFSAGALTTPTAAARVRDRIDAVVLIGGGANLFELSQDSVFTDGGVTVRCGEDKLRKEQIDRLSDLYLGASKLDPYHTAPLLRALPVLQVHARSDDWVPARGGELLWNRLGKPDRLDISAGHQLLFYLLPGKAKFIADWVDQAVTDRLAHK